MFGLKTVHNADSTAIEFGQLLELKLERIVHLPFYR